MLDSVTANARPMDPIYRAAANRPRLSIPRTPIEATGQRTGHRSLALPLRPQRQIYRPYTAPAQPTPSGRLPTRAGAEQAARPPILLYRRARQHWESLPPTLATANAGPAVKPPEGPVRRGLPGDRTRQRPDLRTASPTGMQPATLSRATSKQPIAELSDRLSQFPRMTPPPTGAPGPLPRRWIDRQTEPSAPGIKPPNRFGDVMQAGGGYVAKQSIPAPRKRLKPDYARPQNAWAPVASDTPRTVASTGRSAALHSPDQPADPFREGTIGLPEGADTTEVHLDGQVLGQWMLDHIERALTRAPTKANFVTNHGIPAWPGQSPLF
jgi:hypothetical protein